MSDTIQTNGVWDTVISIEGRAVGMITGLRITADPKDPMVTRIKLWRPLSPDLPRLVDLARDDGFPHSFVRVELRTHTPVDLVVGGHARYEAHGIETDITADAETQRRPGHALSHSNFFLDTLTLVTSMPLAVTFAPLETPR